MKKSGKGLLCLFLFTTLFLFVNVPLVYALSAEDLISNYEIYCYRSSNDDEALYSYEVIKLPVSKSQIYNEETGTLQLSENHYITFSITYTKDGKTITEEPIVGFESDGRCILKLSQEIPEGTLYKLNVTETISEIDEETNTASVTEETKSTPDRTFTLTSSETMDEPRGTSLLSAGWARLQGDLAPIGKILIETLCNIIVPAGDAFLDMICNSVGEVVTIDGVVYNRVEKLDIDFFENASGDIEGSNMTLSTSLKSIMGKAIDKVYVFFRNIVVVFYLVILVYIGLKILITSTAEKKADYKSIFMAWVMGVVMLMFFPYVMKYTIKLNSALCQMIEQGIHQSGETIVEKSPKKLEGLAVKKYNIQYGTDDFVSHMLLEGEENTNGNAMMNVRFIGARTWNLPLIIVYFIFIGQLLAILILYYKRVFMIGFLIAIFPIVVAIYPLNKIGDIRMNPFGEWFKEFVVNVFVQSFHAATYKVIVTIGVASYLSGRQNWLFLIICVLFLFEGEKLIRAIFNAKSSANTIGNMAMAGALAMKMMKNVGSAIPSMDKDKEEEDDDKLAKDKARKDIAARTSQGTNANAQATAALAGGTGGTTSATGVGTPINTSSAPIPSAGSTGTSGGTSSGGSSAGTTGSTGTANVDNQVNSAKKDRYGKKNPIGATLLGNTFSFGAQLTGGIVGTTYGLAQNNTKEGFGAAASGFVSGTSTGRAIGKGGKQFLSDRIDKSRTKEVAKMVAAEYEAGLHDDEIGINEADRQLNNERAQAIRKAYAEYAKRSAGWRGKTGAQLDFYKTQMKILNENLDRNRD